MKNLTLMVSPLARSPVDRCVHCVFNDAARNSCNADIQLLRFCMPIFGSDRESGRIYVDHDDFQFAVRKVQEIVSAEC